MSRWHLTGDVEEFAAAATRFLEADACSRNILRWLIEVARAGGSGWSAPPTFLWLGQGGSAEAAATWTPPFNAHVSALPPGAEAGLVALLARHRHRVGRPVAGAGGPSDAARRVAGAWEAATGERATLRMEETLYDLREVAPVPLPPGRRRPARAEEAPLLLRWFEAFSAEAEVPMGEGGDRFVRSMVERGQLDLWEVDGEPVSLAGHRAPVAGVVRIGPVFSPPQHRGRGFARRLVAEVSSDALAQRGVTRCMLFADDANPVSNRIYRQIGYTPREQHADIAFVAAARQ